MSIDSFRCIKRLAKGGFGTLVFAKGKLRGGPEEQYAMKTLRKQIITSISISHIFAEKETLILTCGYPFVTTLHSCFQIKVCLNFLNSLHIFRLSLILKFTVSVKIQQFVFVPVVPCIDQSLLLCSYSCERNKCIKRLNCQSLGSI